MKNIIKMDAYGDIWYQREANSFTKCNGLEDIRTCLQRSQILKLIITEMGI